MGDLIEVLRYRVCPAVYESNAFLADVKGKGKRIICEKEKCTEGIDKREGLPTSDGKRIFICPTEGVIYEFRGVSDQLVGEIFQNGTPEYHNPDGESIGAVDLKKYKHDQDQIKPGNTYCSFK